MDPARQPRERLVDREELDVLLALLALEDPGQQATLERLFDIPEEDWVFGEHATVVCIRSWR